MLSIVLIFLCSVVPCKVVVLFIFLLASSSYLFLDLFVLFYFSLLAPVITYLLFVFCSHRCHFCYLVCVFVFVCVCSSCVFPGCWLFWTDSQSGSSAVTSLWFLEPLPCLHRCLCVWSCLIPEQPVLQLCALPYCLNRVPPSPILCCAFLLLINMRPPSQNRDRDRRPWWWTEAYRPLDRMPGLHHYLFWWRSYKMTTEIQEKWKSFLDSVAGVPNPSLSLDTPAVYCPNHYTGALGPTLTPLWAPSAGLTSTSLVAT